MGRNALAKDVVVDVHVLVVVDVDGFLEFGCDQAPLRDSQPEKARLCRRIVTLNDEP